ncbi:MAG: hypothetical protein CMG71_07100 [Candidatus Marinimicrobia bacterium]|nr:hypothetical protein [Candidatus Neomarinimicrobiota bacterium]|tara:strand:+ start:5282 stop:5737 length:456 start_codon:yes stop_codon:yes gene_type:complete
MLQRLQLLLTFLITSTTSFSQKDTNLVPQPEDAIAFITVSCDSSGLDIFVDDILVGQTPIDEPIPIKPGIHTVTYLNPQFVTLLREYYGPEEVESILAKSLQRVYVAPGKSVTLNLWWKPYERYLVAQKRWGWIKMAVGLTVASMLLVLNI